MRNELPRDLNCFICGRDNPYGLRLYFKSLDHNSVSAKFVPKDHLAGFKGMLHGGIISAVLDDAMDWALYNSTKKLYVTAQLTVSFHRPCPVGEQLEVVASSQRDEDLRIRKIEYAKASLLDQKGELIASAEGKFFQIQDEKANKLMEEFCYGPSDDSEDKEHRDSCPHRCG